MVMGETGYPLFQYMQRCVLVIETPHFNDFGISGRVLEPQNHIIYVWRPQDTSNSSRKNETSQHENLKMLQKTENIGNRWAPTNHKDSSGHFLKILNRGSISS